MGGLGYEALHGAFCRSRCGSKVESSFSGNICSVGFHSESGFSSKRGVRLRLRAPRGGGGGGGRRLLCLAGTSSSSGTSRKYMLTVSKTPSQSSSGCAADLLGHTSASTVLLSPLLREPASHLQHHVPPSGVALLLQSLLNLSELSVTVGHWDLGRVGVEAVATCEARGRGLGMVLDVLHASSRPALGL